MPGQFQSEAPDGSHRFMIGNTDDPKHDGVYYVSQQDNEGHHQTDVYDSDDNLSAQSEKGKGL